MDEAELNSSLELPYSYSLPGKAPASKAPKKTTGSKAPGPGRGKSNGKIPVHRIESPEKTTQLDLEQQQQQQPKPGKGKGKSNGGGKSKQPINKLETPLAIKERPKIQAITPAGADIGTATSKPPYTYASLITQALAAQADPDGKMLVSEMCEWMAGVYPFYGAKEKGSDWQVDKHPLLLYILKKKKKQQTNTLFSS
jgi:hypothetical protein